MDDEAPWRRNRPGPNPIKVCGHPFLGVPGADDPYRIKPDLVHTFHIGFGADMCASMIVLLCEKQQFGNHRSFDDRLLAAYSHFQSYCHSTHRYTACEEWSKRTMGMTKFLDCYCKAFISISRCFPSATLKLLFGLGLPWASPTDVTQGMLHFQLR